MFFQKPRPAPPPEPTWESKTLVEILAALPNIAELSNRSLVALLKRLDQIALFDANVPEPDRVDATRIADAVEKDFARTNTRQAARAVAEAREFARRMAARMAYTGQFEVVANKIAAAIHAPCCGEILARLDDNQRATFVDAIDHAIATKWTPERAAPAILFNLLSTIGEDAACERLTQKILANGSPSSS
jgi:hypothetical protein